MGLPASPVYRFGDLLSLARQAWIARMVDELRQRGYPDYRRSDALVLRLLRHGPMPIGRLGDALGVTRQAARKVADTLTHRGFATTERDRDDARQINVSLTVQGRAYADTVITVIDELDRELGRRVRPADLAAVDRALRAVLSDEHARTLAARVPPPAAGVRA